MRAFLVADKREQPVVGCTRPDGRAWLTRAPRPLQLQTHSNRPQPPDEIEWQPARDPALGPRPPSSRVPPLLDVALQLLVAHIEDVVSLWGVPDVIKIQVGWGLCGFLGWGV